jgi:excisionase family DNA binding protein
MHGGDGAEMKKAEQPKSADRERPGLVSDFMTTRQVAEYLNCHISTVYQLIKNTEIPAFRLGRDWRFRRAEIDRWIAKRQMAPAGLKRGRGHRRKAK